MESYQFIISLIEGTNDLIHSTDSDGNFEFVNNAWLETLGYDESEIHNLGLKDVIFPGHVKKHLQLISSIFKGRSVTGVEVPLLTKSGNIIQTKANMFPRREKGEILGVTGFFRDITEEKEAEKRLKESKARAEWLVDLMVHDLTNINQEILSTFEVLLFSPSFPQELSTMVREALPEVEKAANLINNVRKISRLDSAVPKTNEWDLAKTLEEVAESVRESFPDKKLVLKTNVNLGQYFLIADEYLGDVFYSLLHNSMKFDSSKQVTVEVDVEPINHTPFLRIQVKDYGPGIPDPEKESIFDTLSSRRESALGRGIGLTLVKKLLEHYDSYIRVEDRVEGDHTKGANFVILMKYQTREMKGEESEE